MKRENEHLVYLNAPLTGICKSRQIASGLTKVLQSEPSSGSISTSGTFNNIKSYIFPYNSSCNQEVMLNISTAVATYDARPVASPSTADVHCNCTLTCAKLLNSTNFSKMIVVQIKVQKKRKYLQSLLA